MEVRPYAAVRNDCYFRVLNSEVPEVLPILLLQNEMKNRRSLKTNTVNVLLRHRLGEGEELTGKGSGRFKDLGRSYLVHIK